MSSVVTPQEQVVVADAVRSPLGIPGQGTVSGIRPWALLAQTAWGLLDRTRLEPGLVTQVLVAGGPACERTAGEASAHMGIHAPVLAPCDAASVRGSVLPAAARAVGSHDVVLVLATSHASPASTTDSDRRVREAELLAARWGLLRSELDAYAELSRERAREVSAMGEFAPEIIPAVAWSHQSRVVVTSDETIGTTAAAADPYALGAGPGRRLHRENVSRPAAGAAAALLLGADRAAELGLRPRARILAFAEDTIGAKSPGSSPLAASRTLFAGSGLDPNDLDHYEVEERFSSVPLAWQRAFAADLDRFNPRSGSLGLGDPGPASGLRSLATMLSALEATGGRLALHASEGSAGTGEALLLEHLPHICCSHEVLGLDAVRTQRPALVRDPSPTPIP
ncbi:MAG TPA: hypothetical protein VJ872_08475 [Nocardioides sp.]|nr:hypothetical protein [Nocardioides sp.]